MADSDASKSPEEQPPRTRIGDGIREGRKFGQWFATLTVQQTQTLALGVLTLSMVALCGWYAYRNEMSREKDKDREAGYREAMQRECNAQAELTRQNGEQAVAKALSGQKELVGIILSHQENERQKERQHATERDREYLRTVKELRDAWAAFAVRMSDFEKYLKKNGLGGEIEDSVREVLGLPPRLTCPLPRIP